MGYNSSGDGRDKGWCALGVETAAEILIVEDDAVILDTHAALFDVGSE